MGLFNTTILSFFCIAILVGSGTFSTFYGFNMSSKHCCDDTNEYSWWLIFAGISHILLGLSLIMETCVFKPMTTFYVTVLPSIGGCIISSFVGLFFIFMEKFQGCQSECSWLSLITYTNICFPVGFSLIWSFLSSMKKKMKKVA